MPGYSLLPTVEKPTSKLTFRLSNEEMEERNEWIRGAFERKMSLEEIAYEVGLSVQRVKQIACPTPSSKTKRRPYYLHGRTPEQRALNDFWENQAHPGCAEAMSKHDDLACMDCFGMSNIIRSEYDANGQPYSWAMPCEFL